LNQVSQSTVPASKRLFTDKMSIDRARSRKGIGKPITIGSYEAGPGYARDGLNNTTVTQEQAAEQEQVMKSQAAGVATLDSFLAAALNGFEVQNFFTFGRGDYWKSHTKWYDGGHAYPSWKALSLFNNEGLGDMLRVETISAPGIDLKAYRKREAVGNAPLIGVYATRDGDRLNVFVLSRKVPGYPVEGDSGHTPVSVAMPFNRAKSVKLYRMSAPYNAHNLDGEDVTIEEVVLPKDGPIGGVLTIDERTGGDVDGLPPASLFLYVFEGIRS